MEKSEHAELSKVEVTSLSCYTNRLPRDILLTIFLQLLLDTECNAIATLTTLSCVCKRWRNLCQDKLVWEVIAKRVFAAYPLITRLRPYSGSSDKISSSFTLLSSTREKSASTSLSSSTSLSNLKKSRKTNFNTESDKYNSNFLIECTALPCKHEHIKYHCRYNNVSSPCTESLERPTCQSLRGAIRSVEMHVEQQRFCVHVRQQRSFVLHIFLSLTLLSFALFVLCVMFVAEGWTWGMLCSKTTSFTLLWITEFAIAAMIITNVIMQAHFEPQPLVQRWRRNWSLIRASSATMLLGIFDVVVPTVLIEVNLSAPRQQRFSWVWCGITVIASFCAWQCYALIQILPDVKRQLQYELISVNIERVVKFVVINVPNAFPLLYAMAAFCTLQYVQHGHRLYVLIGGVPVVVSLLVLSLVFILDYCELHRKTDLEVGVCLFIALFCPLSFIIWGFHGWCLLPLALSTFGFYFAHARYVIRCAMARFTKPPCEVQGCVVS